MKFIKAQAAIVAAKIERTEGEWSGNPIASYAVELPSVGGVGGRVEVRVPKEVFAALKVGDAVKVAFDFGDIPGLS